tara:strand:+ start:2156 stop:3001 length:846 start_codon:yes stop_codon:yes gene_type:complete
MGLLDGTTSQAYYGVGDLGNYQFASVEEIINNFMIAYVGEGKLITTTKRTDVAFHAQRALQELSFDTFRSSKALEIKLPPSLTMPLPQDYVGYVKISVSRSGVQHILYPTSKTSNPQDVAQSSAGNYTFDANGNLIVDNTSETWEAYQSTEGSFPADNGSLGGRFGLDPASAHGNGSFYIDDATGLIHFSSVLLDKTIVLEYLSDSLGTDKEMKVHKFAEEAMYKCISYAILSTKLGVPEYVIRRYKKEKSSATRQAKLRLSNLKIEEIAQIMRGKSKIIK